MAKASDLQQYLGCYWANLQIQDLQQRLKGKQEAKLLMWWTKSREKLPDC